MKNKVLHFYTDPCHGWVKVEKSFLEKMGIEKEISVYSYMRGDYAYLEEDSDAAYLAKVMKDSGYCPIFKYHSTDRMSKIRGYDNYRYVSKFF